jgi:hypothetical protein
VQRYCDSDRFLTSRQQELYRRRVRAEKALEWKQLLDREEKEVEMLEAQAASLSSRLPAELDESSHQSGSQLTLQYMTNMFSYQDIGHLPGCQDVCVPIHLEIRV